VDCGTDRTGESPLREGAGARVETMYIGVGNRATPTAGGSGLLFIDDIGYGAPLAE